MLRVLDTVDHNPNVEEVGLVRLLEHIVQAVVAAMLLQIGTEIDDLLAKGILIICHTTTVLRIHDVKKVIEVIILLALVLVKVEFVIYQLQEFEDLLLYRDVHEVDVVLLLFCLATAHIVSIGNY